MPRTYIICPPGTWFTFSTLMAVPFDLKSLSATGPPAQVLHGVLSNQDEGYASLAVARSGNLVYVSGPERTDPGVLHENWSGSRAMERNRLHHRRFAATRT
jgi:hypothetical protein